MSSRGKCFALVVNQDCTIKIKSRKELASQRMLGNGHHECRIGKRLSMLLRESGMGWGGVVETAVGEGGKRMKQMIWGGGVV